MHQALSAAIANGELFALYQPLVSTVERRVIAVEALVRWERPGFGIIRPSQFVPFAEENGFIHPIGTFMLNLACQDASSLQGIRMAVNVSRKQFSHPDLANFICEIADRADLSLNRLEVEVTETASFPDLDHAIAQLNKLRARGVTVSLDDLGSGHATLELMAKLPLDRVKLGRDVVEKHVSAEGAAHLHMLVTAARQCGLGITAEGIETQADHDFLSGLGSDLMQGFLFGRPMSAKDMEVFLARRSGAFFSNGPGSVLSQKSLQNSLGAH